MNSEEKTKIITKVGSFLVEGHGAKPFYKRSEVQLALDDIDAPEESWRWVYCFFLSRTCFDEFAEESGEPFDYDAMRKQVMDELADEESTGWGIGDIDFSWLDFIDLSEISVFDFIDIS